MSDDLAKKHRDANMFTRVIVRDVMNSPVISATSGTSIMDIAKLMSSEKVGSIIIMEQDNPIGIVSDWDIVSLASVRDIKPSEIMASEIMQKLHVIESEENLTEAARVMRKNNIKRLGVIYKNKLVGIISSSDVIAVTPELIDVVSEKSSIIRGEIGRSTSNISGYCDECNEWSDLLKYEDGKFTCEECLSETA